MVNEKIKIEGIVEKYKITYKKGNKEVTEYLTAKQLITKYKINPLQIIGGVSDYEDMFYMSSGLPEIRGTLDHLIMYTKDDCLKIILNGAFNKEGLIKLRNDLASKLI